MELPFEGAVARAVENGFCDPVERSPDGLIVSTEYSDEQMVRMVKAGLTISEALPWITPRELAEVEPTLRYFGLGALF